MSTRSAPTTAAIYLRLSVDTEESTSIEGQEKDCRALAAARGWEVSEVYTDRGVSGGKAVADRPALSRLLADARSGRLRGVAVIAHDIDRMARSLSVFLDVVDTLAAHGALVVIEKRPEVDLTTPMGGFTAKLLALLAEFERSMIADRVKRAHVRHSHDGRYYGRPAPFGWTSARREDGPGLRLVLDTAEARARLAPDTLDKLPPEPTAPILQEVARRVIEGETLTSVARSIEGAPTDDALRRLFRKPIVAGWADLGGQIIEGEDGLPLVAHEPLLSSEDRRALLAALDRRASTRSTSGLDEEPRLLNGLDLVKCAECDRAMALNRQKRKRAGGEYVRTSYVCRNGCASIEAGTLEAEVERRYLAAVGRFSVVEHDETADAEAAEAAEALENVRERREGLAGLVAEGLMAPEDAREALERLARTAATLEAVASRSTVTETDTGETYAERWEAADLDERREHLRGALRRIEVRKGQVGRRAFDPSRVVTDWSA
jgi:site-specific DNA recombinase